LIAALGSGIGRAQAELDRHAIDIEQLIAEDPVLAEYGLSATWYQIPSAEMEVKVAVAMQRSGTPSRGAGPMIERAPPRLFLEPLNARYTNQFSYDTQASSIVKLTVNAVPPPSAGPPASTEADVMAAALAHLVRDSAGNAAPRVTVNFNPRARAWYVVQTSESTGTVTLQRLVKLEDGTLTVLRTVTGS
jgi:hypothetical protein